MEWERRVGDSWARRDRKALNILKVGGDPRVVPENQRKIVGESHCQDALASIAGPPTAGLGRFRTELALLVPEPENPYDPQAVAVHICGQHVGYLSSDDAQVFQPLILDLMSRTGKSVGCKAEIRGSTHYGVDLFYSRAMSFDR